MHTNEKLQFNVVVELGIPITDLTDDLTDDLMSAIRDHHGVVGRSEFDRVHLTTTVEAPGARAATDFMWGLLETSVPHTVLGIETLLTEDFDTRWEILQ